jgi:hypothetical protein
MAAGDLDPDVLDDEQRGRSVVELLADLLADGVALAAAFRAGPLLRGQLVDLPLPGQVGRQRPATMALAGRRGFCVASSGVGSS